MTYNVFGGTLSLTQSISHVGVMEQCRQEVTVIELCVSLWLRDLRSYCYLCICNERWVISFGKKNGLNGILRNLNYCYEKYDVLFLRLAFYNVYYLQFTIAVSYVTLRGYWSFWSNSWSTANLLVVCTVYCVPPPKKNVHLFICQITLSKINQF